MRTAIDLLLRRFAALALGRPLLVLLLTGLAVVGAAAVGVRAADELSTASGFSAIGSESWEADRLLERDFPGAGSPNLVVVIGAEEPGTVDRPDVRLVAAMVRAELEAAGATDPASYWSTGLEVLRSDDGSSGLVVGRLPGDEDAVAATAGELAARLSTEASGGVFVGVGGSAAVSDAITARSESDLQRAELIAAPIVFLLLLVVFRTAVAALLPVAVGGVAVVGTLAVLWSAAQLFDVSIFALNLTTALGLGLAVDYSLLLLTRFREELASTSDRDLALTRALAVAGRSIFFSAATTAVALVALALFPLGFLRSLALAGPVVILLAALLSTLPLPAAIALLGTRLDRGRIRRSSPAISEERWGRVVDRGLRRPVLVIVVTVGFLLVLGSPFDRVSWGLSDDRALAPGLDVRDAQDRIRDDFSGNEFGAVPVVVTAEAIADDPDVATRLAERASGLDGVARVDGPDGIWVAGLLVDERTTTEAAADGAVRLVVVPDVEPRSERGVALIGDLRALGGGTVLVGGDVAREIDVVAAIRARLPVVAATIIVASFLLLATLSRSVVAPVKALVLNALSLTASFGAVVWIFQDGNLSGVLGFTPTGTTNIAVTVLILATAFGLSMDYEVFLLSRIREEYDRTGDNDLAVRMGLARTAGIITASALLIAVVFGSFLTAQVSVVQLSGMGLMLAVLVDAFIVRVFLVPSVMHLAGDLNWWWPGRSRAAPVEVDLTDEEPVLSEVADRS